VPGAGAIVVAVARREIREELITFLSSMHTL
jgi:hypothetical protein